MSLVKSNYITVLASIQWNIFPIEQTLGSKPASSFLKYIPPILDTLLTAVFKLDTVWSCFALWVINI